MRKPFPPPPVSPFRPVIRFANKIADKYGDCRGNSEVERFFLDIFLSTHSLGRVRERLFEAIEILPEITRRNGETLSEKYTGGDIEIL